MKSFGRYTHEHEGEVFPQRNVVSSNRAPRLNRFCVSHGRAFMYPLLLFFRLHQYHAVFVERNRNRMTTSAAVAPAVEDFSTPSRGKTSNAAIEVTGANRIKKDTSIMGSNCASEGDDMDVTPTQQPLSTVTPPESDLLEPPTADKSQRVLVEETTGGDMAVNSPKATSDAEGGFLPQSLGKHVRFGSKDNMEEEVESTTTPTAAISQMSIKSEEGSAPITETQEPSSVQLNNPSSSTSTTSSQRGLVSRRGGRIGSPPKSLATAVLSEKSEPVIEFKTYRSPSRKRDENDTIPSLCSTNSGGLTSASSLSTDKKGETKSSASCLEKAAGEAQDADHDDSTEHRRPSSISCDPSMIDTTSPLASHEEVRPTETSGSAAANNSKTTGEERDEGTDDAGKQQPNVTMSPPPPPIGESNVLLEKVRLNYVIWIYTSFDNVCSRFLCRIAIEKDANAIQIPHLAIVRRLKIKLARCNFLITTPAYTETSHSRSFIV